MPYHRAIDQARERLRGAGAIGTTGRGIGPAYEDKMARTGIRVGDLFDDDGFAEALARNLREKNGYLRGAARRAAARHRRHPRRVPRLPRAARAVRHRHGRRGPRRAWHAGARVLLEGAQGTLLDVDHGTYPFVTSSNCVPGAAAAGAGLPPRMLGRIIGIAKAYTTRVGGGPFPTELRDAIGDRLRADGDEFGATTGRPRRCGWFDAVVVRHAVALSGLDGLALTKLDVLTGIDPIKVCLSYEIDGRRVGSIRRPRSAAGRGRPRSTRRCRAGRRT